MKEKNVLYDESITSETVLRELASSHPMEFAPGLNEVLKSKDSPTVEYFTTLPDVAFRGWVVYLIVLGNPGQPCRVYIGSATDSKRDILIRWYAYDNENPLPRFYKSSLDEGFTMVHRDLLCWMLSIPGPAFQPMLRLFFILLEATFSYIFWAMRTTNKDCGMTQANGDQL